VTVSCTLLRRYAVSSIDNNANPCAEALVRPHDFRSVLDPDMIMVRAPVNRRARWAPSLLDYAAHLLSEGDQPLGAVLEARCGHLLPIITAQHDHPPGRTCQSCEPIFRAAPDISDGLQVPPPQFGASCRRTDPDDPGPPDGTALPR
jgi:hypothetical protein